VSKREKKVRPQVVTLPGELIGGQPKLAPGQFIRECDADLIFHYHPSHAAKLVKKGKLPKPVGLYPGSRAKGWWSETINAHRQAIADAAKEVA
jgi:hypothetical protein